MALEKKGISYECFAIDDYQEEVIDHYTNKVASEKRHMLTESARLARGKVLPLQQLKVNHFSTLILPGGMGAAKNRI